MPTKRRPPSFVAGSNAHRPLRLLLRLLFLLLSLPLSLHRRLESEAGLRSTTGANRPRHPAAKHGQVPHHLFLCIV